MNNINSIMILNVFFMAYSFFCFYCSDDIRVLSWYDCLFTLRYRPDFTKERRREMREGKPREPGGGPWYLSHLLFPRRVVRTVSGRSPGFWIVIGLYLPGMYQWYQTAVHSSYSGGTAPDFHRPSLLRTIHPKHERIEYNILS